MSEIDIKNTSKKYEVVYADPAWKYDFCKDNSDRIEKQYETMELEEIKALPVESITEKNAVLYLWATAPKLIEALEVMSAWSFKYKTHAIWDKKIIGTGYWFRGQHELLLVGTKNNFCPPKQEDRVSSILLGKRTRHSEKPKFIMGLIEKWYPDKTKIELFSRNHFDGWDVWGNEIPNTIQKRLLK